MLPASATLCCPWRHSRCTVILPPGAIQSCHLVRSGLDCQIQRSAAVWRLRSGQTGSKVRIARDSPATGSLGGLPPEVVEAWLADFTTVKRLECNSRAGRPDFEPIKGKAPQKMRRFFVVETGQIPMASWWTRLLVLESAPSLTPEQRPGLEQASPLRTHAEPHPPPLPDRTSLGGTLDSSGR
jgi:hypothetical protein